MNLRASRGLLMGYPLYRAELPRTAPGVDHFDHFLTTYCNHGLDQFWKPKWDPKGLPNNVKNWLDAGLKQEVVLRGQEISFISLIWLPKRTAAFAKSFKNWWFFLKISLDALDVLVARFAYRTKPDNPFRMVSKSRKNEPQSSLKTIVVSTYFYKLPRWRFLARFGFQNRFPKGPSLGWNGHLAFGCPSNTVFRPSSDQF